MRLAEYFLGAGRDALTQVVLILGPATIAVILINIIAEAMNRVSQRVVGRGFYAWFVAMPAVIVHELSHVLFCWVFGHRVTEAVLFDPKATKGSLGYVNHEWNGINPWANLGCFFIGAGPVLVVLVLLTWLAHTLFGNAAPLFRPPHEIDMEVMTGLRLAPEMLLASVRVAYETVLFFGANLWDLSWRVLVFLYAAAVVGSTVRLSSSDFRMMRFGISYLLTVLLCINLAVYWLDLFRIEHYRQVAVYQVQLLAAAQLVLGAKLIVTLVLGPLALMRDRQSA